MTKLDPKVAEAFKKAWAKPMGKPVDLPPLLTPGPGKSVAVFLQSKKGVSEPEEHPDADASAETAGPRDS